MSAQIKRKQPTWNPPNIDKDSELYQIKILNSLTRSKIPFIPIDNKQNHVSWYSCGPTVYDTSHMGHARNYICIDILRRILTDYFGYNLTFVQGLTDIDDKIILRARQNHLFKQFVDKTPADWETILKTSLDILKSKLDNETDKDKIIMYKGLYDGAVAAQTLEKSDRILKSKEALVLYLDREFGESVTDNNIFWDLPRYWENKYWQDMDKLNVRRPNVQIRVSECVPQIIKFIKDIISNGYAYESNGSVYFNVAAFNQQKHFYAKLEPENMGNQELIDDGEGKLAASKSEKQSECDFALWKQSKPGQPSWDSPWSKGRPGWHIECSVMSTMALGQQFDIHTGGVDLKFPHHDNEIAQSEAAFNKDDWCNYFMHSGHLHINGCKMSKSLKNFISIDDALNKHDSRTLRLAFLMHNWYATLDYSDKTMNEAKAFEKTMTEFFLNVKDLRRKFKGDELMKPNDSALKLLRQFEDLKKQVHGNLADNFNTPDALQRFKDLVNVSNVYVKGVLKVDDIFITLLEDIARYLTKMFKVFGVIGDNINVQIGFTPDHQSIKDDNFSEPIQYLDAFANFRQSVRQAAITKDFDAILKACDNVRNETLPNLGVRFEDTEKGPSIKIVGKKQIKLDQDAKLQEEQKKEAKKLAAANKLAEKIKKAKVPHNEMFKLEEHLKTLELNSFIGKFSKFDDNGLPTHEVDESGDKVLAKSQVKKISKIYNTQKKAHENWKKTVVEEHDK